MAHSGGFSLLEVGSVGLADHLSHGDFQPDPATLDCSGSTAGLGGAPGDSPIGFILLAGALVGAYAFGFWRRLRTA